MENIQLFVDELVNYMISFGPMGGFLLLVLEPFIAILPLGLVVGLNILSFGKVWGFLLSYFATITGCMLSFMIFRQFVKDKYIKWFSKKNQKKIEYWMHKLSDIKVTTLAVLFAIPLTPGFLINIAAGLSDISYRKYLMSLVIGKPAMLLFYGYVTVSLVESLTNPIILIRVAVLVLLTYIIGKIIEKIVKVDE